MKTVFDCLVHYKVFAETQMFGIRLILALFQYCNCKYYMIETLGHDDCSTNEIDLNKCRFVNGSDYSGN